jgi:predicted nucleic acid-binding Zn ribbon protein
LSINYKIHAKKTSDLHSEIGELLGTLKTEKKRRYAFWESAVGERIARIAVPTYRKNDVLMVKVQDSVWRFELTRRKSEILENVNKNLAPVKQIKDIIFK